MSLLPKSRIASFALACLPLRSPIVPIRFRQLHEHTQSQTHDYDNKYAEKLRKRAQEQGTSVDDLKAKVREQERERRQQALAAAAKVKSASPQSVSSSPDASPGEKTSSAQDIPRKDSSPVKPLSSIINLPLLYKTPHTSDQVSTLWTAYHMSRSSGTGRGFVCAAIPVETYQKMLEVGKRYPTFVVPVPRGVKSKTGEAEAQAAYEFYFLQWNFHEIPAIPSAEADPFAKPQSMGRTSEHNPQTSTVIFTPVQEYKLRQSFATPYLVLTLYTDLARTHGVVLLRGEITPSAANTAASSPTGDERYLISQADAQLLAMGMQRFYLWNKDGQGKGEELLKIFHESPAEFKWEDLLEHSNSPV